MTTVVSVKESKQQLQVSDRNEQSWRFDWLHSTPESPQPPLYISLGHTSFCMALNIGIGCTVNGQVWNQSWQKYKYNSWGCISTWPHLNLFPFLSSSFIIYKPLLHTCLWFFLHPCMSHSLSSSTLTKEASFGLSCSLPSPWVVLAAVFFCCGVCTFQRSLFFWHVSPC